MIEFKNHFEWQKMVTDDKNDVHMWHRSSERGQACLKAQGTLDFTPKQVWLTLMGGMRYKSQYDKNIDEIIRFEKVVPNTYTMYQRSRKIPLIS